MKSPLRDLPSYICGSVLLNYKSCEQLDYCGLIFWKIVEEKLVCFDKMACTNNYFFLFVGRVCKRCNKLFVWFNANKIRGQKILEVKHVSFSYYEKQKTQRPKKLVHRTSKAADLRESARYGCTYCILFWTKMEWDTNVAEKVKKVIWLKKVKSIKKGKK